MKKNFLPIQSWCYSLLGLAFLMLVFVACNRDRELQEKEPQVKKIEIEVTEKISQYEKLMENPNLPIKQKLEYQNLKDSLNRVKMIAQDFIQKIRGSDSTERGDLASLRGNITEFINNYENHMGPVPTQPVVSNNPVSVPTTPINPPISSDDTVVSKSTFASMQQSISNYKQEIAALNRSIASLKSEKQRLGKDYDISLSDYKALNEKYQTLSAQYDTDLQKINADLQKVNADLNTAQTTEAKSKSDLAAKSAEMTTLQAEKQKIEEERTALAEDMNQIAPLTIIKPSFTAHQKSRVKLFARYPKKISKREIEFFELNFIIKANKKNLKMPIPIYIVFRDKSGNNSENKKSLPIEGYQIHYNSSESITKFPYDYKKQFEKPKHDGPYSIQIYTEFSKDPFWQSENIETN